MLKNLGPFLKSKTFFKHLALAILVVILFFTSVVYYLSSYTRHGEFIVLPNLSKTTVAAAEQQLKSLDLKYIIIDSVYVENSPPGIVINQNPYVGAHVKKGRNIYLYITASTPPMVEMPKLVDQSFRQAKNLLENAGLKVGNLTYKLDPAPGVVLTQKFNGKPIAAGTKLKKGSSIDLEVAKGVTDDTL